MKKMVNGNLVSLTDVEVADLISESDNYVKSFSAIDVRNQRDRLLSDTDWMALSDNTMTPAWAAYRQALRDITAQEGFPYSVNWPTKP
tara:strand:+ start:2270 stop:2533 length:264 start_codon:yes stop_codon:yes gene_type:complete